MSSESMTQRTLSDFGDAEASEGVAQRAGRGGQYGDDPDDRPPHVAPPDADQEPATGDDWPPFDEYGPEKTRPLPPETKVAAWRRRLQARGFSWKTLAEEGSHGLWPGLHIDDRNRPGRVDVWIEHHPEAVSRANIERRRED